MLRKIIGIGCVLMAGVGGMGILLILAWQEFGWVGVLIGSAVFPATIAFAPIWAGLSLANWIPAIVVYGGLSLGALMLKLAPRDESLPPT